MKEYNGHRSWNMWNSMLWLSNDETLERRMRVCDILQAKQELKAYIGCKTPDGAIYTKMALKKYLNEHFEE